MITGMQEICVFRIDRCCRGFRFGSVYASGVELAILSLWRKAPPFSMTFIVN